MYDQKVILHTNRCYVYMNKKEVLIKGGCFVKVSGSNRKKVLWEVVEYNGVEEVKYHYEIGLRGFGFNLFDAY